MQNLHLSKMFKAYSIIVAMILLSIVNARPWLDPGDMRLRHELQILADAGLLDAPLTTWPLSSKDIRNQLKQPDRTSVYQSAIDDINRLLANKSFTIAGESHSKESLIRDFSGKGREKNSISYDGEWSAPKVDIRLKASLVDHSDHPSDENFRLDESYLSTFFGNWRVTAGQQSRWWGPGWDGSLILSNNARPIPSLSLENISSKRFSNKYLHWIGPYKFHMFIGQLESKRAIQDTKLIGTRLTFKPFKTLEVGLHRSIQWGGKGEDNSIHDLIKTLISIREDSQSTDHLMSVRGNQIAGADFRWKLPIKSKNNYALYGQYIGEDRKDGSLFLGDETFLIGGSRSGYSKRLNGSWRTYIEATDTSAASFKSRTRNNIIYNHANYKDGYRHQGLSMGHSIDSDSQIISLGTILSINNGNFWRAWMKYAKLNVDGVGKNPIASNGKRLSAIGVSLDKKISENLNVNLGTQLVLEKDIGEDWHDRIEASIGFSYSF